MGRPNTTGLVILTQQASSGQQPLHTCTMGLVGLALMYCGMGLVGLALMYCGMGLVGLAFMYCGMGLVGLALMYYGTSFRGLSFIGLMLTYYGTKLHRANPYLLWNELHKADLLILRNGPSRANFYFIF